MVRAGQPSDLNRLEAIENEAFTSDRLSRRSLRYFLRASSTDVLVAHRADIIVGYAMIGFRARSRLGRIFSLAVDAGHTRLGVGRAMLDACEVCARRRICDAIRLEVRADNLTAIRLYESVAYRAFATEPDYYEDGCAARRFEKTLSGAGQDPDARSGITGR